MSYGEGMNFFASHLSYYSVKEILMLNRDLSYFLCFVVTGSS